MRATEEQVGAELRAILGDDGLRENEPLAAHTTFRIGGPARWLALPSSEEEARAVVMACRRLGWPWRVLGLGSNILAADEGLDEVVIKLADRFAAIELRPEAPEEGAEGAPATNGASAAASMAKGATGAAVADTASPAADVAEVAGVVEALADVVERGSRDAAAAAAVAGIATLKAAIGEAPIVSNDTSAAAAGQAAGMAGSALVAEGSHVVGRIAQDLSAAEDAQVAGASACAAEDAQVAGAPAAAAADEAACGWLVFAQAGATNAEVAEAACAVGLAGYEFASGIPGTVGGAAVMNAGAYGGEFADVAVSVRCLTPEGAVVDVPAADATWGYRSSLMMERGYVVLGATLRLTCDDPDAIRARMDDLAHRREEKQPLDMPSAGSTFKRPEGHFAGKLIQDAGLQGCAVGGAQVSTKHAGFVVNTGDATAADVRALIAQVQECVEARFNVRLEPEVRLWERTL